MAYTNKIPAVSAVVLILAAMIAPRWTEAQTMPKLDPLCAVIISDIVEVCYLMGNVVPSEECCKDLKLASSKQVTCLCDNLIAHPSTSNLTQYTQVFFDVVHTSCGVTDKFTCKGGDPNGGATKKISASMGLLGLVASLFF